MKISEYQQVAQQVIEDDKDKVTLYHKIDDINDCRFSMPESLQALSWIKNRKFVSVAPKNAIQGAIRTFATNLPQISIAPVAEGEAEWQRADSLERGIEWNFEQLCRRGEQSALWQVVENAIKYCAVAFQTEYIPMSTQGKKGAKWDDIRRRGSFNFIVHNPSYVHPSWGKYGLECVVLSYVRTLQELIDEFGMSNPGVAKMFAKVSAEGNPNPRKINVQFYDYTDSEDRTIWATLNWEKKTFSNTIDAPYILKKEKHGMGFINWVIVDNKEPIMRPLVDGDVWDNANILMTIQHSVFIALAAHPRYWTNTTTKNGPDIDFDNPNNIVNLGPGETIGALDSPAIDPGLSDAVKSMEGQIYESTAPRILSSAENLASKGTSFSTINAVLQLSIAQLGLAKITAERALEEGLYQVFRWINLSGIPMITFMSRVERGQNPSISVISGNLPENAAPNEINFNLETLYIKVELQPQTMVDEQARLNNAILEYQSLGVSQATAMEDIGIKNPAHEAEMRLLEDEKKLAFQARSNPQNTRENNNSNNLFKATKGISTQSGQISAQQYAPSTVRESITGKTENGSTIA